MAEQLVFIGTYTKKMPHVDGKNTGVACYKMSGEGKLKHIQTASAVNPSYVCTSKRWLFSTREDQAGSVSSFSIAPDSSEPLTYASEISVSGADACHIALHDSTVAVSNYSGANIFLCKFDQSNTDGQFRDPVPMAHTGNSNVDPSRQEAPHPHCAAFKTHGSAVYLYVCDLGKDAVMAYTRSQDGRWVAHQSSPMCSLPPGCGPRHMVFHPSKPLAYVVNELDNTVSTLTFNEQDGSLNHVTSISTLPADAKVESNCAAIRLHPNGKHVYVSNRGHDSVSVLAIAEDGSLSLVRSYPTGGLCPRDLNVDPTGMFLLCANQNSDNLCVYRLESEGQVVGELVHEEKCASPVCVEFY